MAKRNDGSHDAQKAAELRKMGHSEAVVRMMDQGLLKRDPATLTSAAAAANDIGDHDKAERLNKEAYAKSGGNPSEHQRNSFNRTKANQRKNR